MILIICFALIPCLRILKARNANKKMTSRFIDKQTRLSSQASISSRQPSSHLKRVFLRKTIWIDWAGFWPGHPKTDSFKLWKKLRWFISFFRRVILQNKLSLKKSTVSIDKFVSDQDGLRGNLSIFFPRVCSLIFQKCQIFQISSTSVGSQTKITRYIAFNFQTWRIIVRSSTCKSYLVENWLQVVFLHWMSGVLRSKQK